MALKQNQIQRIMMLRGFGYHVSDVADDLKISPKTVSNYLQRFKAQAEMLFESDPKTTLDIVYFKIFGLPNIKLKV